MRGTGTFAVIVLAAGLATGCSNGVGSQRQNIINPGPDCEPARTPGFWCQNQDGGNPNLTAAEFQMLAEEAAGLLWEVPQLNTAAEIASRVCDESDQLLRHLAALALNLAANLIDEDTPLEGEPYDTVGEAFQAAIDIASDPSATAAMREAIKDILDRINNNRNTDLEEDVCEEERPDAGVPDAPPRPDAPPPPDAPELPDAPDEQEDAPPRKGADATPVQLPPA